jgi:AmpE protein
MNLLVVIIVLGLRHQGLFQEPSAAVGQLMRRWRDMWLQRGSREGWAPALVLGLAVLLPAFLLALLLALPDGVWQAVLMGVAGVLVLGLVLLDRQQPSVVERYQSLWQKREWPADSMGQSGLLANELVAESELAPARRNLVEEALRELFAPLFWFLLLGPVGGLVYYLLRLMAEGEESTARPLARQMLHYAEWPVARVLALGFALAGDFTATWQYLQEQLLNREVTAVELLEEAADKAQAVSLKTSVDIPVAATLLQALSAVQGLLQRTLVLWVVLLALHTLLWF